MVGEHHAHQRIGCRAAEFDHAAGIDGQPFDRHAAGFKVPQRFDHARVFEVRRDRSRRPRAEDREVVRFGRPAGERHFIGECAEQPGDGFAGVFECLPGLPSGRVRRRRIAGRVRQHRPHRLPCFGEKRRGGVVIEVNWPHEMIVMRPASEDNRLPAIKDSSMIPNPFYPAATCSTPAVLPSGRRSRIRPCVPRSELR